MDTSRQGNIWRIRIILLIFPALLFVIHNNVDHPTSGARQASPFSPAAGAVRRPSTVDPPPSQYARFRLGTLCEKPGLVAPSDARADHLPPEVSSPTKTDSLVSVEPAAGGAKPVAAFTVSPCSGSRPLAVTFTNLSTAADGWAWDFGDGTTSSIASPRHIYRHPGTYTVALTAFNSCGKRTVQKTDAIQVNDCQLPHASFVVSVGQGTAPHEVAFTCQSYQASSWSWDFGDGLTSTEEHPLHVYRKAGTYSVTLAVSNDCGTAQQVCTNCIVVTRKPQLPIYVYSMDAVIQNCWLLNREMVSVQIVDSFGEPVADAIVHGFWLDTPDQSYISTTDHSGRAVYYDDWRAAVTPRTFRVTKIEKSGCLYNRELDAMRSVEVSRMTPIVKAERHDAMDLLAASGQPAIINYPNPFNAVTEIMYFLPGEGPVSIKIYNTVGQHITTLTDAFQPAGVHSLQWNGRDTDNRPVASGIYFCILQSRKAQLSRKIVLIK